MISINKIVDAIKGWNGVLSATATYGDEEVSIRVETSRGRVGFVISQSSLKLDKAPSDETDFLIDTLKLDFARLLPVPQQEPRDIGARYLYEEIDAAMWAAVNHARTHGGKPSSVRLHPLTLRDLQRDLKPDAFGGLYDGSYLRLATRGGPLRVVKDEAVAEGRFEIE